MHNNRDDRLHFRQPKLRVVVVSDWSRLSSGMGDMAGSLSNVRQEPTRRGTHKVGDRRNNLSDGHPEQAECAAV